MLMPVTGYCCLLIMLQSTGPERSELEAAETKEEASGHQSWLTGKSIHRGHLSH